MASITQTLGKCGCRMNGLMQRIQAADFLAPLLLRLYLVPVFLMAATSKFVASGSTLFGMSLPKTVLGIFPVVHQNTIDWFGNKEWGLGMPAPELMAYLAAYTEFFGAILLLLGLAVRWTSIPLMFTMIVAAVSVHWQNGWLAIATGNGIFATERTVGAVERLDKAKDILKEHGNYEWLTQNGGYVVLNNGIEFAATYFTMLLALLFMGGGKWISADYWIQRRFSCEVRKMTEA